MRRKLVYFFIILIYSSSSYAVVRYVAQTSNGTGDGTSFSNRMSVATHNESIFTGGDVIFLCGKIESQLIIPSSGRPGEPITYRGYESVPAIFTGEISGQISATEKSHINIDKIEFDGSQNNGTTGIRFRSNSHYITITRCKFHDMISNASKKKNSGIFFDSGSERNSHITIGGSVGMGNEMYNIGVDTGDSNAIFSKTDDLIFSYNIGYGNPDMTSGIDGLTILSSNRCLIEGNKFYEHKKYMAGSGYYHQSEHGEDGIDLKGVKDVIVRYNVIHSNRAIGVNVNIDDPQETLCDNVQIYNNLIYGCGANIRFAGSEVDEKHSNVHVWGNVLHSSAGTNLTSSTKGENFYIYNNTFYNPLSSDRFQIAANQLNFNIKNNIFVRDNSRRQLYLNGAASRYSLAGNLYFHNSVASVNYWNGTWESAAEVDQKGIDADPLFVNISEYDFRLANDSPARGSGVPISGEPPPITVFGKTYNSSYADILSPTTDWSVFPAKVNISKQSSKDGWTIGAYGVKTSPINPLGAPRNLILTD